MFVISVLFLSGCAQMHQNIAICSQSVVVAVIDTGVVAHRDLGAEIILPGYDFIEDTQNALDGSARDDDPTDPGGGLREYHGTQMAGLIQRAYMASVPASLSANLKILPLRVVGKVGSTPIDISDAILYASGYETSDGRQLPRRVDIINLSLTTPELHPAIEFAVAKALEVGVVIIAGAGNDGKEAVYYPANYPGVIAVSSLGANGKVPAYANRSNRVDIYAPGGGDFVEGGPYDGLPAPSLVDGKEWYVYSYGTSTATAVTSGVVASILATTPNVTKVSLVLSAKLKLPAVGIKLWSLHQNIDKHVRKD